MKQSVFIPLTLSSLVVIICLWAVSLAQIISLNKRVTELEQMEIRVDSTLNLYTLELTPENFEYVCHYYEIKHPEIVYAQAQLESAYFTSPVYKSKNNFLGLWNSRRQEYYKFPHWSECLKGYRDYVQMKWDGNCDYYQFLTELPYAMDSSYVRKVKYLAQNHQGK